MSNELGYYIQDEYVIDRATGEAFASISATARIAGIPRQTLSDFLSSRNWELKSAEIPTASGLRSSRLLDVHQITEVLAKYNTAKLAIAAEMGVRLYIYKLAGYEVSVKPQVPTTYLEALKECARLEEARLVAEAKVEELTPKAEVHDLFLASRDTLTFTRVAKMVGMHSAQELTKVLRQHNILWQHEKLPRAGFEEWFKMFEVRCDDDVFRKNIHITPTGLVAIQQLLGFNTTQQA